MAELSIIAALRLWLFLALPVLFAWLAFKLLLPVKSRGAAPLQLGLGLMFGPLLAALALYLGELAGGSLQPASAMLGLVLTGLATLGLAALAGRLGPGLEQPPAAAPDTLALSPRLHQALWFGLLAIIGLRLLSLLPDLLLQPVLPWDAWKTWAWKARVWFEAGELLHFAPSREWASASADQFVIDGVNHPHLISLVILWSAVGLGYWDDTLLGLPWLLCGLGMALTVYGMLRLSQVPALLSLAAVYVLLSLPMLSTHIVLWGYADLWMAGLFTALSAGVLMWSRAPDRRWLVLMLLSASVMALTKDTGSYWLPVIAAALIAIALPNRWTLVATGIGTVLLAILLLLGIDPASLVSGGRFRLTEQPVNDAIQGMSRHLFIWLDWHLMGYLLPVIIGFAILQARQSREIRALLILVSLSLAVIFAGFILTRAAQYAAIGTLFSRILMQVMPAIVALLAVCVWQFIKTTPSPDTGKTIGNSIWLRPTVAMVLASIVLWGGFSAWTLHGENYQRVYPDLVLLPNPLDWRLIEGEGGLEEAGMRIDRPGNRAHWRLAISVPNPIEAHRYERLEIILGDERPWLPLNLTWSRTASFGGTGSVPMLAGNGPVFEANLQTLPGWQDNIYFIGLESFGALGDPLLIQSARLVETAPNFASLQQRLFGSWLTRFSWTQSSAHRTVSGWMPTLVSPVLAAAVWAMLAMLLLRVLARRRQYHAFLLMLPVVVAWLALDARWQADLAMKAHSTLRTMAGQTLEEKRLDSVDGELYQFALALDVTEIEDFSGRIFSFGHNEYWRTRVRYHLASLSVRNASDEDWDRNFAQQAQSGDILILIDTPQLEVQPSNSTRNGDVVIFNREIESTKLMARPLLTLGENRAFVVK